MGEYLADDINGLDRIFHETVGPSIAQRLQEVENELERVDDHIYNLNQLYQHLENRLGKLGEKIEEVKDEIQDITDEIRNEARRLEDPCARNLTSSLGNLLISLAKYIFHDEPDVSSISRLQQLCSQLDEKQLENANVPSRYLKYLYKLDEFIKHVDGQADYPKAHIAYWLCLYKDSHPQLYETWEVIFKIVYGCSPPQVQKSSREEAIKMLTIEETD